MSTKCYPKNCCRIWKRVGWLAVHEDNYSQLYPKAEIAVLTGDSFTALTYYAPAKLRPRQSGLSLIKLTADANGRAGVPPNHSL